MKFNISTEFLIVVFLFLSVMIISTYGSIKIMPYESKSSSLSMYPYRDGFLDLNAHNNAVISVPTHNNVKPNVDSEISDRMNKLNWGEYGKEHLLDIVSELPGNPSCENISAGLSNSKGYLCTNKEVQNLYKTRGGNSSGQPYQIGA